MKTQISTTTKALTLSLLLATTVTACSSGDSSSSDKQTIASVKDEVITIDPVSDTEKDSKEYTTTASGLKYKVLSKGKGGKSPVATDTVTVHYQGVLTNGKEFDSSYKRGTPATFPLNAVIKGWTEGLQLMQEGDKFEFYIPAELAYGSRSPSSDIPPNSPLIFTVELLKVN